MLMSKGDKDMLTFGATEKFDDKQKAQILQFFMQNGAVKEVKWDKPMIQKTLLHYWHKDKVPDGVKALKEAGAKEKDAIIQERKVKKGKKSESGCSSSS